MEELILISYTTKLTLLRVEDHGHIHHVADMDLDDEIVIYASELSPSATGLVLVATKNSIWFFNVANDENIDVDTKMILPEVNLLDLSVYLYF